MCRASSSVVYFLSGVFASLVQEGVLSDTVRAAVQLGVRQMEVQRFPRPKVGPDNALVRIERAGICGSDAEQYVGHMGGALTSPIIRGHEPLGIIEEIGERAAERWGVKAGDRVAVEIVLSCRSCNLCLTGQYMSCRQGRFLHGYTPVDVEPALWGGYAEYMYLHQNSIVHRVRNDIDPDVAVMFNPLGAGVRWAVQLPNLQLGESVLILGPGQRGLASVVAAKAAGASQIIVTGLSRDENKLELCGLLGADYTINVDTENTVERVREITDGAGVDVAIDVTPMALQPIEDAMTSVRRGGRVVLAGLKGRKPMNLVTDTIINKGISVIGAYSVDARGYAEAIKIIESGAFPLEKLHTHTFGLEDTGHAIEVLAGEVEGEDAVHVSIDPHR
jgi:threonine dehydrogenase-like Zn-dependent dehydrogenase